MSTLRSQLLSVCDAYCAAKNVARPTLSTALLGAGHRLDKLATTGDLTTRTLEGAMQWLSDNWPADADWPEGVTRPAPLVEAAE